MTLRAFWQDSYLLNHNMRGQLNLIQRFFGAIIYYCLRFEFLGCTTDYTTIDAGDPFAFDFGEDESINWAYEAYSNYHLVFNMKQFYFNNLQNKEIRIMPNSQYFMKFDPNDRKWYSKIDIEDDLFPHRASQEWLNRIKVSLFSNT